MKQKKQRLPRKMKKEKKKLKWIGMNQIQYGTRKGFGMNKWTWKLYFAAWRWLCKNTKIMTYNSCRQGTLNNNTTK